MFKKLLIALLVLYVVITSTYFIYKYAPAIEQYLKGYTQEITQTEETPEVEKAPEKDCVSFAIGHIAIDQFRVQTRFMASASDDDTVFKQNNLQQALATLSCDKANQKALIYYDSKPVAIAHVESFDYSKPLADNSEIKPEFYTVLKVEKKLADFPDNGYVIAVYDYYDSRMDFYNSIDDKVTDDDEKLIAGSCDTIYYQVIGKDPQKTEIEYSAIKAPLNMAGIKALSVLATWIDPSLPKGVTYNAIFNMHIKKDGSASRHPLFPITKVRNSEFHLFQMLDLNNDGFKETVVRKNRDDKDTFTVYYYDRDKDAYFKEEDQSGE
jgi:hypothetical protein